MKIAFVTYEYSPFVYGGAGVYADNIVKELEKRGHEVHVITFGNEEKYTKIGNLNIHHLGVPNLPFQMWIPSYWICLLNSFSRINREYGKFDVLINNGFSALSLIKRLTPMPRILVMHQSGETVIRHVNPSFKDRIKNLNNEMGLPHLFDPILSARADKIVAVSKYVKSSLIKDLNIDEGKIEVVYNGFNDYHSDLDVGEKNALKKKYGIEGKFSALFVGRVSDKRKGLKNLLDSIKKVDQKKNFILLAVGNSINNEIYDHIKKLELENNVKLLGKIKDDELKKLYSICDAYISNSYYESFGLTLVEAMSANKPIIARDVGGIGEVITKDNGILIKDTTNESMTKAIDEMFSNLDDYRKKGLENRDYAINKFSWEKAAEQMESIALELIAKKEIDGK